MPETNQEEGEIYVADLIGMAVVHADGRVLGQVKAAHDFGAGDLIEVQPEIEAELPAALHRRDYSRDRHGGARAARADPDSYLPESPQRQDSDGLTN